MDEVSDELLDRICYEIDLPDADAAERALPQVTGPPEPWIDALRRAAIRASSEDWYWYEPVVDAVTALPGGEDAFMAAVRDDDFLLLAFAAATKGSVWAITAIGVEEAGREFARQLARRAQLQASAHTMQEERAARLYNPRSRDWISDAAWDGMDLAVEMHRELILHAVAEADDDTVLWQIGEGPCDILVDREWDMIKQLHRDRLTHPNMDRLFRVRQAWGAGGWWADPA